MVQPPQLLPVQCTGPCSLQNRPEISCRPCCPPLLLCHACLLGSCWVPPRTAGRPPARLLPTPTPQLQGERPSKATHEALRDPCATPPHAAAVGTCLPEGSGGSQATIPQAAPPQHRVCFSPQACLSAYTQKHDSIIISLNLLFEMALGFNAFSIFLCHLKSIHKTPYMYYLN